MLGVSGVKLFAAWPELCVLSLRAEGCWWDGVGWDGIGWGDDGSPAMHRPGTGGTMGAVG